MTSGSSCGLEQKESFMVFEHRPGKLERMLWIADAVTWAVGSGHAWTNRLGGVLTDVIELQP